MNEEIKEKIDTAMRYVESNELSFAVQALMDTVVILARDLDEGRGKVRLKKLLYPKDCARIQKVFVDRGFYMTLLDAQQIWSARSEDWGASWLSVPDDDVELWERCAEFWEEEE